MMLTMKRFSLFITAFLLATFIGCASTSKQESTGQYIDDTTITGKVKAAYVKDPTVKALSINVETFKGVVQLSGFANSQNEISKAESLAREVGGVRSVKNDIKLKGAQ